MKIKEFKEILDKYDEDLDICVFEAELSEHLEPLLSVKKIYTEEDAVVIEANYEGTY